MFTKRLRKAPFYGAWKACLFLGSSSLLMSLVSLCLVLRCFEQRNVPMIYGNEDQIRVQLELLIDEISEAHQRRRKLQKDKSISMDVHVQRKQIQESISSDKGQHVALTLNPAILNPLVEHVRGAEVISEGIRVLYTGLYYVYCGMNVTLHECNQGNTSSVYIHRISPNGAKSGVLLQSLISLHGEAFVTKTTFTGGVFYLQAEDVVQVCLSNQHRLASDDLSSFVGLFLLSSYPE
ncbi:hypothetical protein Btru_075801 [Bulinus truncatus]|nr:hypothetical protein Btru_075801 [Bulinus truncatus]